MDQLKDFNVRFQGRGGSKGDLPKSRRVHSSHLSILCFCRFHKLVAGVPGDHGATALGAVGVVSSFPLVTAQDLSPEMVGSTVRAAVPASAPATRRTAQRAQVRGGRVRNPWEGIVVLGELSPECWTKEVFIAPAACWERGFRG